MTISASDVSVPIQHADRFFIGGQWVLPSSDSTITVIDSYTEEDYFTVAEAQAADMDRAISAAKEAFDNGPWPRMTHAERATYLRALGDEVVKRSGAIQQMWPREAGVLASMAGGAAFGAKHSFDYYADLADTFQWERPVKPSRGGFGLVVKEPVGVVGAIIPWNAPMGLISMKLAPALIAGCTVVLKSSPEAPGEGYVISAELDADAFAKMSSATFMTTGQVCMTLKRLYVPRSRYDEVIDGLRSTLTGTRVGPGLDAATTMGPLNTAAQRDYVAGLLEQAKAAGAEVQTYG